MNSSVFYATSILISGTGIFLLWHLGLKPLMLDDFRDKLFAIRDRLYRLSQDGRLSCNSDAYRAVELFLNSVIQYAHRFTFLSFLLTYRAVENERGREQASQYAETLAEKIGAVNDVGVREELELMLREVAVLLPQYIAKSSTAFMASAGIYFALRSISPIVAKSKQAAVSTFESEAFRAAESEKFAPA